LLTTTTAIASIKNIKVGDWVIADDPTTVGEIEAKRVLELFSHTDYQLLNLVIDGETISVTPNHEFWVVDKGWLQAEDLGIGSLLQTEDGRTVDVDGITKREKSILVYNFEVDGFHSYFVSKFGVLVHNMTCDGNPISVDDALEKANQFLEPDVPMRFVDGETGVQVIQTFTDAQGRTITRRVGFDLNPNTPHVQQLGPHLNLQTQINGKVQNKNTSLADPHIPIDPSTIRQGDF
jgi:Pretoxin HINT domain